MTDQEAEQLYGAIKAYKGPTPSVLDPLFERLRGSFNAIMPPGIGVDRNYGLSTGLGDNRIALTPGYNVGSSLPVVLTRGVPLENRPRAELGKRADLGDLSESDRAYKEGQGFGFLSSLISPVAAERAALSVGSKIGDLTKALTATRLNALGNAVGMAFSPDRADQAGQVEQPMQVVSQIQPEQSQQLAPNAPAEYITNQDKLQPMQTQDFQNEEAARLARVFELAKLQQAQQPQVAAQPTLNFDDLPSRTPAGDVMDQVKARYPDSEISPYKPSRNIPQRVMGFLADLVNNPLNTDAAKLANERAYYTNELTKRAPKDAEAAKFLSALQAENTATEQERLAGLRFDTRVGEQAARGAANQQVAQINANSKAGIEQTKAELAKQKLMAEEEARRNAAVTGLVRSGYADTVSPTVIQRVYGDSVDPAALARVQQEIRKSKEKSKDAQAIIQDTLLKLAAERQIKKPE